MSEKLKIYFSEHPKNPICKLDGFFDINNSLVCFLCHLVDERFKYNLIYNSYK